MPNYYLVCLFYLYAMILNYEMKRDILKNMDKKGIKLLYLCVHN